MKAENVTRKQDPEFCQVRNAATGAWLRYYDAAGDAEAHTTTRSIAKMNRALRVARKEQLVMEKTAHKKGYTL